MLKIWPSTIKYQKTIIIQRSTERIGHEDSQRKNGHVKAEAEAGDPSLDVRDYERPQ